MTAAPVIWYVHPYAGGPGVGRFYRPFEFARNWQSKGVKTIVITAAFHHILNAPGSRKGLHDIEGVSYEFLPMPAYKGNGIGRLLNMFALNAQLHRYARALVQRHGTPDMIIGSSPHPFSFFTIHKLVRRFNAMSVFEVRDLWPLSLTELLNVSPKHPLVLLMGYAERYAYRHADAIVSLLPEALPYMAAHGLKESRRWHYIPNGADMKQILPVMCSSDALTQAKQWRDAGKFVLVYPGALGMPNNLGPLVQAIKILRQRKHEHIGVIIVGKGEQEQQLRAQIAHESLQNSIAIYPQVSKDAVVSLLQNTDAGYISLHKSSVFRFGVSPNKLFDYMRAKLPIIYAIEAGNDPVRDCRCGYSVAPDKPEEIADALVALAALPLQERQAMGQRGYDYGLENHHYPRLADKYLNLLQLRNAP